MLRFPVLRSEDKGEGEPQRAPLPPVLFDAAKSRRRGPGPVVLVVVLAAITVGGVLIGRALEPGKSSPSAVRTAPPASVVKKKPVVARPLWGPLSVSPVGAVSGVGAFPTAAVAGKRLVVSGGVGNDLVLAGPPGGTLRELAKLPSPRAAAASFVAGGALYVIGGEQGTKPTDAILRVALATGKLSVVGKFVEPLAEAGAVARDGSVYLVGGWTGEKYATAVLRYAPSGQPSLVARLPVGVRSPAVALVGSRLVIAGGRAKTGRTRTIYSVDVKSGAVKALGVLPQALDEGALVSSGSHLYLLGGRDAAGKPLDTIFRINPATGQVTRAGTMAKPLAGATAVPFGTKTLLIAPPAGAIYQID